MHVCLYVCMHLCLLCFCLDMYVTLYSKFILLTQRTCSCSCVAFSVVTVSCERNNTNSKHQGEKGEGRIPEKLWVWLVRSSCRGVVILRNGNLALRHLQTLLSTPSILSWEKSIALFSSSLSQTHPPLKTKRTG